MKNNNQFVTILLATYNPNIEWFIMLLKSLNELDYPNLKLIVRDDCSKDDSFAQVQKLVEQYITNFPYKILRNSHNIGSNLTFEALIYDADTPYIAFCDQDDIWHKDKISVLMEQLKKNNKKMICSDVRVINPKNKVKAKSITRFRKRFNFFPENQAKYLIYKNFVIGCTILIDREFAKSALPVSRIMNHDHDLAVFASNHNELIVCEQSLVDYRIHKFNQSLVLGDVHNKQSYFEYNILKFKQWTNFLHERYRITYIKEAIEWADARIANYNKERGGRKLLKKVGQVNLQTTRFELYALHNPLFFKIAVFLIKHNII